MVPLGTHLPEPPVNLCAFHRQERAGHPLESWVDLRELLDARPGGVDVCLDVEKSLLGDKPVTQQQYFYSRVLMFVYQAAICR